MQPLMWIVVDRYFFPSFKMNTPAYFLPYKLPRDMALTDALQIDVDVVYMSKRTGEPLDLLESIVVYINEDGTAWLEVLTTAKTIQSYKASADHTFRQLLETYTDSHAVHCEELYFQIGTRGYTADRNERKEFMDSVLPKLFHKYESSRHLQLNLVCEI